LRKIAISIFRKNTLKKKFGGISEKKILFIECITEWYYPQTNGIDERFHETFKNDIPS